MDATIDYIAHRPETITLVIAALVCIAMFGAGYMRGLKRRKFLDHVEAVDEDEARTPIVHDTITMPITIVSAETGLTLVATPVQAVATVGQIEEETVDQRNMRLAVVASQLAECEAQLERKDQLRKRYLCIVRKERTKLAEVIQLVPELEHHLATGPVLTALRKLEEQAA